MRTPPHPLEAELIRATRYDANDDKVGQAKLEALIEAVEKLGDDEWEALSHATRNWVNSGVAALLEGQPIRFYPPHYETDELIETHEQAQ